MSKPTIVIIDDDPPARHLTIGQVCACLQVSQNEWNAWRAAGQTPLHSTGPDGQLQVRAADLARWLDDRTIWPERELTAADIAAWHRQRRGVATGPGRRLARLWHVARHRRGGQP